MAADRGSPNLLGHATSRERTIGARATVVAALAAAGPVARTAAVHQGFGLRPAALTGILALAVGVLVMRHPVRPSARRLLLVAVLTGLAAALPAGRVAGAWAAAGLVVGVAAVVGVEDRSPLPSRWWSVLLGYSLLCAGFGNDVRPNWRVASVAAWVAMLFALLALATLGPRIPRTLVLTGDRRGDLVTAWMLHLGVVVIVLHSGFWATGLARGAGVGYAAWQAGFGGREWFRNGVAAFSTTAVVASVLVVGAGVALDGRPVLGRAIRSTVALIALVACSIMIATRLVPDGTV